MFTGIITHMTEVVGNQKGAEGLTLSFKRPADWRDIELGESIATNGACLTVAAIRDDEYDCYLMQETLDKTAFGQKLPESVNLERSLRAGDRFGGHFVQGHVDCVGAVSAIDTTDGHRLSVDFPKENRQYVIYKGSITIDGVALTVTELQGNTLSVALIPHTLEHTTLGKLAPGDSVNLEFDMIGKYVVGVAKHSDG